MASRSNTLHVAFCANDRFLPGLAVALHSTLLHVAERAGGEGLHCGCRFE